MLYNIKNLTCSYDHPFCEGVSRVVIRIESLQIHRGNKVFIVGESGIGKSTILEVLGIMNNTIAPDSKTQFLFYEDDATSVDIVQLWNNNSDMQLSEFRRRHFSFIFQSTNLMKNFTAYENISITKMLQGYTRQEAFETARKVMVDLGMPMLEEDRMAQELSGGQQQRLAFARAIIPNFSVLFGDEPTGNIDEKNANKTMDILSAKLAERPGTSAIIVSHNMRQAVTYGDLIIKIQKKEATLASGEKYFYGFINQDYIFTHNGNRWENGVHHFSSEEMEKFLKNE